jgi:hypothetical protein
MKQVLLLLHISLLCTAVAGLANEGTTVTAEGSIVAGNSASDTARLVMLPVERGRELKGKGGKGSKSGSKGRSEDCEQMWIWFSEKEFKDSFEGDGLIGTNQADIHNQRTGKRIGQYQEVTTGIGPKDCYSSGVYTLDYDNLGRPRSQIFTSSTCYARSQAIVGGTGNFACATGTVSLTRAGIKTRDNRMISACNLGCTS